MLEESNGLSAHSVFILSTENGNLEVIYSPVEVRFIMTESKEANQLKFVHAAEIIGLEICCLLPKFSSWVYPKRKEPGLRTSKYQPLDRN